MLPLAESLLVHLSLLYLWTLKVFPSHGKSNSVFYFFVYFKGTAMVTHNNKTVPLSFTTTPFSILKIGILSSCFLSYWELTLDGVLCSLHSTHSEPA